MSRTIYRAALYMRLSRDDGGAESSSIRSQRSLLNAYAREHGFEVFGEYVDDGWSGTNFDRPEFSHMLADIEAGYVNLVLTKDLSRLGRDYIGAGRYTEIYFPSKGVRCIAVNDGYDSLHDDSDLIPFKHVMNELYARDISRKIRSALTVRMEEGLYIGNFAPYGYRKDPAARGRLIPDEDAGAADVVRRIFRAAAGDEAVWCGGDEKCGVPASGKAAVPTGAGFRAASMAALLNRERIPSPSAYRLLTRPDLKRESRGGAGLWTANTIVKIIHNPVYLGHLVQGKHRKVSLKSRQVAAREPEDYIVALNTHEALVSPQIFAAAEGRISRKPSRLSAAVLAAANAYSWQWASDATPPE